MEIIDGVIYSLISIAIVFTILLVIIGLSSLCSKIISLFENKNKNFVEEAKVKEFEKNEIKSTEIVDDDMMAAVLVATIDYQQEIKEDVRLINVKEIK